MIFNSWFSQQNKNLTTNFIKLPYPCSRRTKTGDTEITNKRRCI